MLRGPETVETPSFQVSFMNGLKQHRRIEHTRVAQLLQVIWAIAQGLNGAVDLGPGAIYSISGLHKVCIVRDEAGEQSAICTMLLL